MTQVSSYNMAYCAREYRLRGHERVAAYIVYACGGSFFIGLIRLIAALGALCVDYKAKASIQEDKNQNNATQENISILDFDANPDLLYYDDTRVSNYTNGIAMCKKDISFHWKQVARAIVELTVVGGWLYTLIEAVQHYRSSSLHWLGESSVDTLDWGRCKGMLDRFTSDFKDRQYVPEAMLKT